MPKVSVLIPTYNRSKSIREAVDSVLNQTYKDFELIVVDDGSTDDTGQVLNFYKDKIMYFYQENKGRGAARNRCIAEAKGEYIAFLDSDDIWFPEKLEKQINYIEKNNFKGLLHTKIVVIDENGEELSAEGKKVEKVYDKSSRKGYTYINLLKTCCLFLSSAVFSRDLYEKVGAFNEKYAFLEDFDFILRLVKIAPIKLLDEELIYYRRYNNNTFINNPKGVAGAYFDIFENQLNNINEIENQEQKMQAQKYIIKHLINFSFELKDLNAADKYINMLAKDYPFEIFTIQHIKNIIKLKTLK